jgi:hypothetical protein
MDQNPYESPKQPSPKQPRTPVRPNFHGRLVAAVVILLLTPLAAWIAAQASCNAGISVGYRFLSQGYDSANFIGWSIVLIPAFLVAIGMVSLAIFVGWYGKRK